MNIVPLKLAQLLQSSPFELLAFALMLVVAWFLMPRIPGLERAKKTWAFDENGVRLPDYGHQPH